MATEKIVVLLGSASDLPFAHRIEDFLRETRLPVKCEYRVSSAHRHPGKLLNDLEDYERSGDRIVFITVAGLSDALSGVVSGNSKYPVIACPPDIEKHGFSKVFSSMMTPKGVAVSLVSLPENAALAAAKIFALSNSALDNRVSKYIGEMKNAVEKADSDVKGKETHEREREHIEHSEQRIRNVR